MGSGRVVHGWRTTGVIVAAAVLLVSGCSASGTTDAELVGATGSASASASETTPAPEVTVTPSDGADDVRLDKTVVVSVMNGTVSSVSVRTGGKKLKGALNSDGTGWESSGVLKADKKYTVSVEVTDTAGAATTHETTFSTLKPSTEVTASITPSSGSTVGVGMPIVVSFSTSVKNKEDVEKALEVTTSRDIEGAWHWVSGSQVQYRPKTYWPAHTDVEVTANLSAVQMKKGAWGTQNASSKFTIGDEMISTVDVSAHTMTVKKNGTVIKRIPITTGMAGYRTRNGVKVIMTKETTRRMDAATTGVDPKDPNYYNIVVKYAMRLTWSGEFLHAAPWSVASQGRANVSHGCTGMSTAYAKWLFNQSKIGDVVVYTNSSRSLESGNGWTLWNDSWKSWKS